jgi:alanine racemase
MSLTLTVDGARWRGHLDTVARRNPGLVPVAKGNGYGFGVERLAHEATRLGVDTFAVGTYGEIAAARAGFADDLLVLTPWRPFGVATEIEPSVRLIHTVSRLEDLEKLYAQDPYARFVLERMTSMLRHGMGARELREASALVREHPTSRCEGVAIHLPLQAGSNLTEAQRLMTDVVAAGLSSSTLWISHLEYADLATLRATYRDFTIRPRIGTDLWLGDRGALTVSATVIDVHHVDRGDSFGYRSRTAPKTGTILVVSGGTAHGIGLEAPSGDLSLRSRAATIARGGMDAVGFVRSPYSVFGKQRLFAEPPHMQASLLFLPQDARVPKVGDEVEVRVRYTATTFDRVVVSGPESPESSGSPET